jgi:adenylate cyclase
LALLYFTDPTGTHRRFHVREKVAIGRHPAQDIQLLDRVVSKEHAVIERRNGEFFLVDVGSRNGTYVNGHQIGKPHQLEDGDEITIGSTAFTYKDSDQPTSLIERVTVLEVDSAIRTRISHADFGFLPETKIANIETLRADYEKLRIANELNSALSMEFDLEKLLHKILDRAFAIFKCDRGVVLVQDEHGDLVPRAARERSKPQEDPEDIRISETILNEVIENRQAILSNDARVDQRFSGSHSIILEGIRSTMSVPLLYQERLLGVIHLDTKWATGAFSEKDIHLLAGFARQASMALEHSQLVDRMQREAVNREKLGRLLPPVLVDQVLEGRMELRKGGDFKNATIMFADIRGFTAMSERTPSQEIVTMLNEYFEIMVEVIFRRGGTLDKFIGDEIMAIWGAPFSRPDDVAQAVATAVEMQQALVEYNETRTEEGLPPIYTGIGLNTGELVAGYMGSTRSMSYTVVGDVVNTASRVTSLAGPGDVVITADTLGPIKDLLEVEALPPTKVKGKREPIEIFKVTGLTREMPYPEPTAQSS